MKRTTILAAALLAAFSAGALMAADKPVDLKAAQKTYNASVAKAKSDFDKAIAECKKMASDKQSGCYKEARQARRQARDAASDAYFNDTGRPEPAPGA